MAKRGQAALYEMMRAPRASAPSSGPAPVHEPAPVSDAPDDTGPSPILEKMAQLLTPGRTIRIHMGYVFLAIGLILGLALVVYIVGYRSGWSSRESTIAESLVVNPPASAGRVNDPLDDDGGSGLLSSGRNNGAPAANPSTKPANVRTSAQWGPVEPKSDPRVKGWNYYVLAETTPQGATRLAEFCRGSGLETYVIPANNGRRKVIAFPGFQGSVLSAESIAIKERITSVGVKFKRQNKNAGTDLSDAYASPYDG